MYNLCVFTCIIVMFVFHCTHVRMSYVLNSYLLTYLSLLGGESWRMGVVNLAVLVCLLRTSTKKKSSTFWGKKCTPEKILATPMNIYNNHTCKSWKLTWWSTSKSCSSCSPRVFPRSLHLSWPCKLPLSVWMIEINTIHSGYSFRLADLMTNHVLSIKITRGGYTTDTAMAASSNDTALPLPTKILNLKIRGAEPNNVKSSQNCRSYFRDWFNCLNGLRLHCSLLETARTPVSPLRFISNLYRVCRKKKLD